MSADITFYRIAEPGIYGIVGGRIDVGSIDYDRSYWRGRGAVPEWVKRNGHPASFVNRTIDLFDAGRQMFGRKPTSISMNSYDLDIERFHFDDGSIEEVNRWDLEPYYYDEKFDGWVYGMEKIGEIPSYLLAVGREWDEQEMTCEMLEDALWDFMEENSEELDDAYAGTSLLQAVYVLTKAMMEAKRGACVVCQVC